MNHINWNTITLDGLENDPNIATKIQKEIEHISWIKSPFASIVGNGADRGVRTYLVENDAPFRPRLKPKLNGTGVEGNTDFDANYDNLEILSTTIFPKVVGNSLLSPIKQYSAMQQIDFVKESVHSLGDWMQDYRDKSIVSALVNDFTNVVCADAANTLGYRDTTTEKSVSSATKKIAKGDKMNVKMLRQAIYMANEGVNFNGKASFPLKPIRSQMKTEGGLQIQLNTFLILLTGEQARQLREDSEWIEMQKFAAARGDENKLFTGLLGMIDNCPVINMGNWTSQKVGMPRSSVSDADFKRYINVQNHATITPPSFYSNNVDLSFGALIGASAIIMAGGDKVNFYYDDKKDAGRKTQIAADRLLAIAKARFSLESGSLSPFSNQDFATIGLVSANE